MEKKLGKSQLNAWELFLTRQSSVLREIEKELDARKVGLPLHWYDVLLALKKSPEGKMRLSDIADHIVTSRSALTRSIDKIESAGLIQKVKCSEDGRGMWAQITEQGRKAQKDAWVFYQEAIQSHFGKYLSEKEAEQLVSILSKIPSHLGEGGCG